MAALEPVRLLDQNRAGWDRLLIGRGVAALGRAERLTDSPGPYVLQAAIASCHALATVPEATDWARIAGWAEPARVHGLASAVLQDRQDRLVTFADRVMLLVASLAER